MDVQALNANYDGARASSQSIPEYATVADTAKILGLSVATVQRRIGDGTFQAVKIGHLRRILLRQSLAGLHAQTGE